MIVYFDIQLYLKQKKYQLNLSAYSVFLIF